MSGRSPVNGSHRLRWAGLLARALHILLLAVLGGAAAGGGCLVTDPVPYEPAENIPPIVLPDVPPRSRRDLRTVTIGGLTPETSVDLSVTVREYNLDDTLSVRMFIDDFEGGAALQDLEPSRPTGDRDRVITESVPVGSGRLADNTHRCHKVLIAISDRGWGRGPPFYEPPSEDGDAGAKPETVVAMAQWWIWVDDGTTIDGPGVADCGRR
jgi:hypothetical protein